MRIIKAAGCPGSREAYILETEEKGENPCHMLAADGTFDKGHGGGGQRVHGEGLS